jgi:hypothetical protein
VVPLGGGDVEDVHAVPCLHQVVDEGGRDDVERGGGPEQHTPVEAVGDQGGGGQVQGATAPVEPSIAAVAVGSLSAGSTSRMMLTPSGITPFARHCSVWPTISGPRGIAQCAHHRAHDQQGHAEQEHAALAVHVTEPSHHRGGDGAAQQGGGYGPRGVRQRGVQ